jgi:methylphosphotriester-DNA--protein-cysteine methyltransferase
MDQRSSNSGSSDPNRQKSKRAPAADSPTFELSSPHHRLRILQQWIAIHGARHLTLKEAATIAGLEPHHFSATFHLRVGLTFVQWTREHRAAFAVRALESGWYSIGQVVELAGYQDRRSLERAVKKATGKTPAEIHRRNGD